MLYIFVNFLFTFVHSILFLIFSEICDILKRVLFWEHAMKRLFV